MVRSSGRNVTEVARELGVSPEGLRGWVKQARVDRGEGPAGALTSQPGDFLPQPFHPHTGSRLPLLQHSQHRRQRAPLTNGAETRRPMPPSSGARPCLTSRNQAITFG
ncbi:transposase [Streptomyces sp. NPDC002619]|uniref:transposase n=1 Tax=Streptomyces sp. NPDC002619 TaxID=3364655 RepID=UPI00367D9891